MKRLWLTGSLVFLLMAGCDRFRSESGTPLAQAANNVGAAQAQPGEREFQTRGVIREIAADGRKAVIRHEEIPGYMPKMVMELNVRDTNELRNLKVDDEITFKLVATDETHWIHSLRKVGQISAGATTRTETQRSSQPDVDQELNPADRMPDFAFLSETGDTVKLSDFRGKALAFTFIFTRCPIPDFCPRMGRQFAHARDLLRKESEATVNWQLLSISFDPDYDKPEVLARYAKAYRGEDAEKWLFAVASNETLAGLAPLVSLVMQKEDGTISHNLRTVVLDAQGRVHRVFAGNEWKAKELVEALMQAARL